MKFSLLLVLILSLATKGFSCGGAFQYRLFPIGATSGKLVLIETALERYWSNGDPDTTGETRDWWNGTVILKTMDSLGNLEVVEKLGEVDFPDMNYSNELKPLFDKAFKRADDLPGFQIANTPTVEFCNFREKCETVDLISSTTDDLALKPKGKKEIQVSIPSIVIQHSKSNGGLDPNFRINSIRTIKLGENEMIIANIASGEIHNTDLESQTKNQEKCISLQDCIYKEIVIYHGISFDVILLNLSSVHESK